jgi:hypothetical protein
MPYTARVARQRTGRGPWQEAWAAWGNPPQKPLEDVMDHIKRRNEILHALFAESPELAAMIQEADEEGLALYGQCYVQGVDFLLLTLEENLLIRDEVYQDLRATMTSHPSVALSN